MKIRSIKREARQALKNHWGFAVLLSIVVFLVYSVVPYLVEVILSGGFTRWATEEQNWPVIVSQILTLLLTPVTVGYSWVFLRLVRKEPVQIKNTFELFSGKLYWKSLGLTILITIYTFLWSLLLVIPGIIKSFAYSQAYFILKDHPDYSLNQIITESRKMMNGYKWRYFLLQLSFIGWFILSLITLGIGLLWLVPYVYSSLARFYEEISQKREEVPQP
ncbi:DUF975 family protein [Bacillus sp. FSL W8-0102]|uniref:DUF975 family protein n=1 Tax=Bacillus sp. FSL W8-0102 TaxID=2978205 RepID=UPI0030FC727F